ncbi:alpha-galactosidase A [Aspergillus saccharolyticus JOP 1030-1]|uniref:non-specific serine/threonine protein kinase n=1 Tax=Aspergillus saccharolyticus JOP 1030-1 TaxID=1450539 RepID=A0A318Z563_9EURO|nr:alpha-galactosidase A [Aspergillus saccharolyticus JOP 1030-1]PYH42451.1 alpha-galactosidase A [Aspergillus saccharolyticus JOP 1030-1]
MPLSSLPDLPEDKTWNFAYVGRDTSSGELQIDLQKRSFIGIKDIWHPSLVDCLKLRRVRQLTATTYEAAYWSAGTASSLEPRTVIAKVARFEWEIPRLSMETSIYKILQNTGLAPEFVGHVHEHGRIIGFLLTKLEGREASIEDLPLCQSVLKRLHDVGILHGDANKYNFIVHGDTVHLIDFESSKLCDVASASMHAELESLREQLREGTRRGAGFIPLHRLN